MNRLTFSRLGDLIRICNIREDSYHKAYDSYAHSHMAFIFKKYANESRIFASELERYITKYPHNQDEEFDRFVEYKWNKMIGNLQKNNLWNTLLECIECEAKTIGFYKSFLKDYPIQELRVKVINQLVQIEKSQHILEKFYNSKEIYGSIGSN